IANSTVLAISPDMMLGIMLNTVPDAVPAFKETLSFIGVPIKLQCRCLFINCHLADGHKNSPRTGDVFHNFQKSACSNISPDQNTARSGEDQPDQTQLLEEPWSRSRRSL